jgi:hypothetical protein
MGRKEGDVTDLMDTSYPGSWTIDIIGADKPQLCKPYSIPSSVKLGFDTKDIGTAVREDKHEVCVYEDTFEAGFRFPFSRVVREMLHYLRIAPHQLAPNAWWTFFACVILWPKVLEEGCNLSVREFLKIYKLTKNPNTEYIFNF